jgi:hypothetical protein
MQVPYPPQEPEEFSHFATFIYGQIPVRIVISRRVDGWCAYMLLAYMREDYYRAYGDYSGGPTTWERVRHNGDKMLERYARELFPEMDGVPYAS